MTRTIVPTSLICMALTACDSGTNPFQTTDDATTPTSADQSEPGRATQAASGVITVNQAARSVVLPATALTETVISSISDGSTQGHAVMGLSVLAAGGVSDGSGFAGITGTTEATAPNTSATFAGNYAVTNLSGQSTGTIEMIYTFTDGTLRNVGGPLTVDATSSGATLSGTVSFADEEGTLTGGFYPRGRMAGAFNGDTMGGVIFASQ
jgi:hypothetical protein